LNKSFGLKNYIDQIYNVKTVPRTLGIVLMSLEKNVSGSEAWDQAIQEAVWFESIAQDSSNQVLGYVAGPDLSSHDSTKRLEELTKNFSFLCGVRQPLWKNSSLFFDENFLNGVKAAGNLGLVFDALISYDQLPYMRELAVAAPATKININHLAYPPISPPLNSTAFYLWQSNIQQLAANFSNLYFKLSGLPQAYATTGWSPLDFVPPIDTVLKAAGPQRTNFASNWFVLTEIQWSGSLPTMFSNISTALDILQISQSDRRLIYSDTALNLYDLVIR